MTWNRSKQNWEIYNFSASLDRQAAIQLMRDTLGVGGFEKVSRELFRTLHVLLVVEVLPNIKIRYFLTYLFHIYKYNGLKTDILKSKCKQGARRVPKKCHVLFEWPLW